MIEHLNPVRGETSSRRNFAMLTGVLVAGYVIDRGVRLRPPELYLQRREIGEIEFLAKVGEGTLSRSGKKLLFDPFGGFFEAGSEYGYVHRGGNSIEAIQESYRIGLSEMGAERMPLWFDVDANVKKKNVKKDNDGDITIHPEHGRVFDANVPLGRRALISKLTSFTVDVDEWQMYFGMPKYRYKEVVEYMYSLSVLEQGVATAASVELKRGPRDSEVVKHIIDIHQECPVPVAIHSPDWESFKEVGDELKDYYNS